MNKSLINEGARYVQKNTVRVKLAKKNKQIFNNHYQSLFGGRLSWQQEDKIGI